MKKKKNDNLKEKGGVIEMWLRFVVPMTNEMAFFHAHLEHVEAGQGRILILDHVRVAAGLSGHLSAEVHGSAGYAVLTCSAAARVSTREHKNQHRHLCKRGRGNCI